ncbi:hypothetical protein Tco_0612503 [Tanacetum coccineum]
MAHSTRLTSGSNNGEEVVTKHYVDDAMAKIRQSLTAMNSTLIILSIQTNQVVNHGTGRQINQFGRLAKVKFPKFHEDDVRGGVDPKTLSNAYCLTNLQEATLEAIKKKNMPLGSHHVGGFGMSSDSGNSNKPPLLPLPFADSNSKPNPTIALKSPVKKPLTQKVYEKKTTKNMCFYYDKKFVPVHKCEWQLFSLMVLPIKELEEEFKDAQEELKELENEELPQILLNAFTGATKRTGCKIIPTSHVSITMAEGKQLVSVGECKGFTWKLKGETSVTDVMLLPLGGCEMVLGIQWLATLGNIKCKKQIQRMDHAQQPEMMMSCVYQSIGINLWSLEKKESLEMILELQTLIDSFDDVFVVPKQLPPP